MQGNLRIYIIIMLLYKVLEILKIQIAQTMTLDL